MDKDSSSRLEKHELKMLRELVDSRLSDLQESLSREQPEEEAAYTASLVRRYTKIKTKLRTL